MCCLSCLPICTSSVLNLSVNFVFVTPSCLCRNLSVGLVVAYSSHIFCSPQILDGGEAGITRLCRNLLNNGGETAMLVHQQSPLILRCNLLDDDHGSALAISKTGMARLHSNLLNDCGKTAILVRQQSPSIWRCNIFDNGDGGASEIFSNS